MRTLFFIGVVLSAFFTPLPLFLMATVLYALFFRGYELIFVGMCVDAQFGLVGHGAVLFPYSYTLLTGGIVFVVEFAKPYVVFYTA